MSPVYKYFIDNLLASATVLELCPRTFSKQHY